MYDIKVLDWLMGVDVRASSKSNTNHSQFTENQSPMGTPFNCETLSKQRHKFFTFLFRKNYKIQEEQIKLKIF